MAKYRIITQGVVKELFTWLIVSAVVAVASCGLDEEYVYRCEADIPAGAWWRTEDVSC